MAQETGRSAGLIDSVPGQQGGSPLLPFFVLGVIGSRRVEFLIHPGGRGGAAPFDDAIAFARMLVAPEIDLAKLKLSNHYCLG